MNLACVLIYEKILSGLPDNFVANSHIPQNNCDIVLTVFGRC